PAWITGRRGRGPRGLAFSLLDRLDADHISVLDDEVLTFAADQNDAWGDAPVRDEEAVNA
ncbi:MAG TPA: hypothetical protein VIQ76_21205, partial [Propionibacteriaceae bacterium]